jgi:hypothetical protein
MAALTFLETLQVEVARLQTAHPDREGELARAQALIWQGMVLPTADPTTAQVLSSDGLKHYTVNGVCDCQAGQYGKGCKHMQAWKLYQYIAKKQAPQPATPVVPEVLPEPWPDNDPEEVPAPAPACTPLPEAPVAPG